MIRNKSKLTRGKILWDAMISIFKERVHFKRKLTLSQNLFLGIFSVVILGNSAAFFNKVYEVVVDKITEPNIHAMQDEVQKIEDSIGTFNAEQRESDNGLELTTEYRDRITGKQVVVDVREDGRFKYRSFYNDRGLIARDEFRYQDARPIGKIRVYVNKDKVVLVDEFTQTGVLKSKRFFTNGEQGKSRDYLRDFRSPLPPTTLAIYR